MTEQEVQKAIRSSAQDVDVPEQLAPEEVQRRVEKLGRAGKYPWKQSGKSWRKIVAAAVLAAAVGITWAAGIGPLSKGGDVQPSGSADQAAKAPDGIGQDAGAKIAESIQDRITEELADVSAGGIDDMESAEAEKEPKQNAGDMFEVARDYDQVYAMLEEYQEIYNKTYGTMLDGGRVEAAESGMDFSPSDSQGEEPEDIMNTRDLQGYSKTNVQTDGVDESDIIKTDGSYIYTVRRDGIVITDISGETMTEAARIPLEDPGARVMEMYVQENILNLILQQTDSKLEQQGAEKDRVMGDAFIMNATSTTHLLTYDISDRKHPILTGDVSQDGSYYTSRKIGSIVYLFTTEYDMSDIPQIGGSKVAYDCIYLPERGRQGLLVSSVDVKKPAQVLDHVMVINDYVDIYISTKAMYLYQCQYSWQDQNSVTQIAKFKLDRGRINAVDSISVKGRILDTFAINEGDGNLRVLTTDGSDGENANNLFVMDNNLKLAGSLQGLAPGEQIYAARFLGNMAYFVTYRNTDPLFAVDLSDPAEPKVLSELKITGFSEYLHFWGADKLLGIGYETDPDTGRTQGIKLTMFDISNPAELGILDSIVLKELDYSPALNEYKTVLADCDANLFGFAGAGYQEPGDEGSYYLYQWGESGFEQLLKIELDSGTGMNEYRGLYSGGKFYLADSDGVMSYDREKGYEKIESLEY